VSPVSQAQVHALPAGRRDQVRSVTCLVQVFLLHRLDRPRVTTTLATANGPRMTDDLRGLARSGHGTAGRLPGSGRGSALANEVRGSPI
jgi:hypothetical protein